MTDERQLNEIKGTVLGDGTVRLQTGEFSVANHKSAEDLVKFFEEKMGGQPQRSKSKQPKVKHQPKQNIQTHHGG